MSGSNYTRLRSRSPRHHNSSRRERSPIGKPDKLPYGAKILHKDGLESNRNLLGLYLQVQKQIEIDSLDEREIKGRWKSFYKKWNEGGLAEGWYDPITKQKADQNARHRGEDDSDEEIGPSIPDQLRTDRPGPAIPSLDDLRYRDELIQEDAAEARSTLSAERKAELKRQRDRLDELAPRAEAGTHERRVEKRRDAAAANAAFRERRSPGADDIGEGDLMGDDGVDAYKRKRKEEEMRKSERQLRREEFERARDAARKVRIQARMVKEDETMGMLKELAKERYG